MRFCQTRVHIRKLASSHRFQTRVFCLKPVSTHVNDILGEEKSGRKGKVRDESARARRRGKRAGRMHLFDDYFFVSCCPRDPLHPKHFQQTEIINKQKMLEEAGDESGQRAGARRALRMRRCEVSIIH